MPCHLRRPRTEIICRIRPTTLESDRRSHDKERNSLWRGSLEPWRLLCWLLPVYVRRVASTRGRKLTRIIPRPRGKIPRPLIRVIRATVESPWACESRPPALHQKLPVLKLRTNLFQGMAQLGNRAVTIRRILHKAALDNFVDALGDLGWA
jgi:hypothetical protein